MSKAAFHLKPVVDRLTERLKRSGKLLMDEKTAPVPDPGRGTRDDQDWIYLGASVNEDFLLVIINQKKRSLLSGLPGWRAGQGQSHRGGFLCAV